MKTVKIAILGHGNVGGGLCEILQMNRQLIEERIGRKIHVSYILVNNVTKGRPWPTLGAKLTDSFDEIVNDNSIEIVIEALGGIEPAASYMRSALEAGKHVVTANKAALAANYPALLEKAQENNRQLLFEASVGGGIPALTAISNPLQGNEFTEVMGILNGTTNYILSKMWDEGLSYDEVLADAQAKGFAEADPTADVEGIDAANKLSILMALAFDVYVHPEKIPTEGISKITLKDIENAKKHGEKIKLIGHGYWEADENGQEILKYHVKPMKFTSEHPIFGVDNEYNAIYINGNAVGQLMFYGSGAGPLPTGSAVLGDLLSIARSL